MDPAIERLTRPFVYTGADGKQVTVGNCAPGGRFPGNITPTVVSQCKPDNDAFAKLINQYGALIAPNAMHSARTTGFGGFHLSFEVAMTTLDHNADYMQKGTQGKFDDTAKKASTINNDPASILPVYSLKVRKGFPFGFEVGAQVGYVGSSSIVTGGADVRLSLLEGFRKGALGILPDLAVGGGVRTISGTPQFNLTVASFDVQISKPLPVADSSVITPYVGYQQLWIFGDSGLIDTTPNTDPLGYCGYRGPNVPGNPDPNKKDANGKQYYDGQPVCSQNPKGSPLDFNNTFVFDNVRVTRKRLILGFSYKYEVVYFGFQFMTDVSAPEDAGGRDNKEKLKGVPKQNTFVLELGALF